MTIAPGRPGILPYEEYGQAAALAAQAPTGRTLPVVTGSQVVRLNFVDTPIATVASEVIRNVLNMSVQIDDTVHGQMTLKTANPVPISEVPRLLDQALRPYGYGISMENGQVRVGRLSDLAGTAGGQSSMQTIPLHYVNANELIAALQPTIAPDLQLVPSADGTAITVSGPPNEIAGVRDLVSLFDTATMQSRSFGIFPLTNASALSVAQELRQALGGDASAGVSFEPIQRLNAVLVVASQPQGLARARRLIAHLDVAAAANSYVHVYHVVNRSAVELAGVLARLFGAPQSGAAAAGLPGGAFAQLSVGSTTTSSAGLGVRIPGANAAAPTEAAAQPADILLGPVAGGGPGANPLGLSGPVRIQPDPGSNSLVVLASPADYKIIEPAIEALDRRPREVLIEAVIAEVRLNQGMQYGLDALYHDTNSTVSLQSAATSPLAPLLSGVAASNPLGQGIAYLFHNENLGLLVHALSTVLNVNIMSAPRALVLDNSTATLQVGDQVPILVQQQQSPDNNNAPLLNSIEMRDTGVILAVTPRIGSGGNLTLQIFTEVSAAAATTSSKINSPTISVRRIETTVNLETGDTIAIGGLMQDQATRTQSGIPWLDQIPVLGWLFSALNNEANRNELLVLINPRIVTQEGQLTDLTAELRAKLNSIAPTLAAHTIPPPSPYSVPPPPPLPKVPTGVGQFFR